MENFEHLPNAPIQEGLIDLRCTFKSTPTLESFDAIGSEILTEYPTSRPIHMYEANIQFEEGTQNSSSSAVEIGKRFESLDKNFVFQATIFGFTVSRLKPYVDWLELFNEAQKLWSFYKRFSSPIAVERSAVRFINKFSILSGEINLSEYFTAAPIVPNGLQQIVNSYLVRLQIPDHQTKSTILLTQMMEEVTPDETSFVLDIDVFNSTSFDASEKKWWELLSELRIVKNRAFFSSLTPKALDLFK